VPSIHTGRSIGFYQPIEAGWRRISKSTQDAEFHVWRIKVSGEVSFRDCAWPQASLGLVGIGSKIDASTL
jgi:hypothetical protein